MVTRTVSKGGQTAGHSARDSSWCPRGSGRVPCWVGEAQPGVPGEWAVGITSGPATKLRFWGKDSQQPSEYLYPYFTEEESKTQKAEVTFPRSPKKAAKLELQSK